MGYRFYDGNDPSFWGLYMFSCVYCGEQLDKVISENREKQLREKYGDEKREEVIKLLSVLLRVVVQPRFSLEDLEEREILVLVARTP
jgi:hypothetical protein